MTVAAGESPGPTVHRVTRGSRLLGFIATDSTVAGRARGGLRMVADLSEDEIRCAARAMTLKYGLLGLPQGGAKGGIIVDGEGDRPAKERLLREFAEEARPLLESRAYVPDADLGTSADDVRWMMTAIGARVGPREWQVTRSGEHTARSCLAASRAVMERAGASLDGCRVAIEGFGKVGSALARLLSERGARVVAISTARGALYDGCGLNVPRLLERARDLGSRFVEHEPAVMERSALVELQVDLLCPCARFHSIHAGNVDRVAAKAIVAGANDPVSAEAASVSFEKIGPIIETFIIRRVRELLDRAERSGVPPRRLAEADALERHAAIRARSDESRPLERFVRLGIGAYHRRWIPEALVSRLAVRRLARGLR